MTASPRYRVLAALSATHFVNDMMQSLLLSIYPMLKGELTLSFVQLGLISLTYQLTASVLQPLVGSYTDRRPQPFALCAGMGFTTLGLLTLALAKTYALILVAAALIGMGSSIFHPESSRLARRASGGRHGLAQSIFQIGGNSGSAMGPLLAALIIAPAGRPSIGWFALLSITAIGLMWRVALWTRSQQRLPSVAAAQPHLQAASPPARTVMLSMLILLILMFSKYVYLQSLSSFYTFYLIERFAVSTRTAQLMLFVFLFASAAGTLFGGLVSDRIGRKQVIWISILGVAPFTLLLPHVGLLMTGVLTFLIGLILASAFGAIVVYAQELLPNRVGMVSGLFFGLAFGLGAIAAAVLGGFADRYGIETIYRVCAFLPLLGMVTAFLPDIGRTAPGGQNIFERVRRSAVGSSG
jgi:FSR family fosmidomycin resistance protein-like MFS transporter